MPRYIKLVLLTGMFAYLFCISSSEASSKERQELLKQQLARIRAKNIGKGTNWEKLENECLALIKDYNSPPDKGRIYATIARIYTDKGYSSSSEDVRIPKAIKYSKKALQHPLEATTACAMYGNWADALMVKYFKSAESEFVKRRREAIIPCLTGLKLALDNKAPKERQKVPPVDMFVFTGPKTHPIYQKLLKKNKEQLAKHSKAMLLNELYFQRWALTRRCVTLYSRKPYNMDELRKYADKALKNYREDVNDLIAEVRAEIAKKEASPVTNLLSKDEINKIYSYRSKYQQFPGPSDAEVVDVAKILLRAKLTKDDIEKLLGKPSDVHTLEKPIPKISGYAKEYWGYYIGDSRIMSLVFDPNGWLVSIQGAGVGFDKPMYVPKDINNPPMD